MDKAALEISNQWERIEMGIRELESTTVQLTEAINNADPADLGDDPEKIIEKRNNEIDELSKVYIDLKKEHYKLYSE